MNLTEEISVKNCSLPTCLLKAVKRSSDHHTKKPPRGTFVRHLDVPRELRRVEVHEVGGREVYVELQKFEAADFKVFDKRAIEIRSAYIKVCVFMKSESGRDISNNAVTLVPCDAQSISFEEGGCHPLVEQALQRFVSSTTLAYAPGIPQDVIDALI